MSRMSRRGIVNDFAGYTSGHGFASIQRNWYNHGRQLWILAMLLFTGLMTFTVYDAVTKYFQFTTTVSVKIEHSSEAHFPAITVCNLNPLRRSKLEEIHHFKDLMDKLDTHGQETGDHDHWDNVGSKIDEELTDEEYMKAELAWIMYSEPEIEVVDTGHQMTDMLLECTFQGRRCSPRNFTKWQHGYFGNCFTLFIPEDTYPSFVGPHYGLALTLFTQDHEYIPILSSESGFRIVIHARSYIPFPEDQGFSISPGVATAVSLKQIQVGRLPLPYDSIDCGNRVEHDPHFFKFQMMRILNRNPTKVCTPSAQRSASVDSAVHKWCLPSQQRRISVHSACRLWWQKVLDKSEGSKEKATNYTNPACIKGCYLQYLYLQCACVDSYVVTPHQVHASLHKAVNACDVSNPVHLQCVKESCLEQYYNPKITTGYWPRDDYIKRIRQVWQQRGTSGIANLSTSDLRSQVAKLTIYFEELNFESIVEYAATDLWDLASTVGGTLGLYGGISFLTMLEFGELFCRLFAAKDDKNVTVQPRAPPALYADEKKQHLDTVYHSTQPHMLGYQTKYESSLY